MRVEVVEASFDMARKYPNTSEETMRNTGPTIFVDDEKVY